MTLMSAEPASEPMLKPISRPMLPLLGPRLTKLRKHTAMMPPRATAGRILRGMLKIVEKPIAETAAAIAKSQYSWCGIIVRSFTKLSMPHTLMAKAMPNAIARTINSVLSARTMPTSIYPSSMSLTKLMSGTPGTMNKAQAMSGCQGVSECIIAGRKSARAGESERNVVAHAMSVATKAAMPMAI